PPPAVPPSPEHIDPVGDDIETLRASLASAIRMRCLFRVARVRARVGLLEQHDVVTQDSLRIARGGSHGHSFKQSEYAESRLEQSHERQTVDGVRTQRTHMIEQGIATLRARAEAAEQRVETLQVSLGAARMDVKDLIESREADRIEMA
ncbi:hypothetical protein Tco_1187217, partial [Tanacetum coccineum]